MIDLSHVWGLSRMGLAVEELWSMSEQALVGVYADARRQFLEKKLARDTQRARLEWMKAKTFVTSTGGVTERRMAVDVSEELARKGQELREMTHELDLLKVDVDVIAIVIRLRGAHVPAALQNEDAAEAEFGPDLTAWTRRSQAPSSSPTSKCNGPAPNTGRHRSSETGPVGITLESVRECENRLADRSLRPSRRGPSDRSSG